MLPDWNYVRQVQSERVVLAIAALCALSARVDGPGFKAAYLAAFLASLGLPATQLLTKSPREQVPPAVVKADICALPHDKPLVVWGVGGVFVYPAVQAVLDSKHRLSPVLLPTGRDATLAGGAGCVPTRQR